ncbi:uncharacterized protein LOC128224560 isoform X2 [Mya arenaria]|nr:uncharacterized protein LOC128224560 isoform X2 [Mya arenaria]
MGCNSEGQQVMSLRLSRVLRDIGITRQMVLRRRSTHLVKEKIRSVMSLISKTDSFNAFFFGSQSEGTTTLGMNSDLDMLTSGNRIRVMKDWDDWERGKLCVFIIKNDRSPPQHCCLQAARPDCPLPFTRERMPATCDMQATVDGRVLLPNTWMDDELKKVFGRLFWKQGPSRSANKETDHIFAFSYNGDILECNFLFTRPKPGHWPRPAILTEARQCEIFLVPQGHAESDQSKLEWRFSTSLIERLLMFDLNILQIQVYTFLKILRKTFFKPLVGDRLSTFHFKTALLFTLETYPEEIWQERYVLQCVIYCLKTLKRWFKLRSCPHYTISGVDLFVGKLRKWEFPPLLTTLSKMIDNIMDYVYQIEMDQIGERISGGLRPVMTRNKTILEIVDCCIKSYIVGIILIYWEMTSKSKDVLEVQDFIIRVLELLPESDIREEIQHTKRFLYQYIATMETSKCLQTHQLIPQDIYRLYEASLDSDLTSSRLKLASMMYCSGQYEEAEFVLAYTESLLHADVMQFCPYSERWFDVPNVPTERFLQKANKRPFLEVTQRDVACSVLFNPLEICCIPGVLVYEMHRTISPEDFHQRHPMKEQWMDLVVIDSKPFIFYLQYLTFRQLGEEERRLEALHKLHNYVCVESRWCGHIETALHVLGHCFELENQYDVAWTCYRKSLEIFPYNNAARWHIMRLIQQARGEQVD